jgi:hypothetical protein
MSEFKGVSAVEWLSNQSYELFEQYSEGKIDRITLNKMMLASTLQAKEMEKQQIENAFNAGFDDGCGFIEDMKYKEAQQYYNETYGKKN